MTFLDWKIFLKTVKLTEDLFCFLVSKYLNFFTFFLASFCCCWQMLIMMLVKCLTLVIVGNCLQ